MTHETLDKVEGDGLRLGSGFHLFPDLLGDFSGARPRDSVEKKDQVFL